MSTSQLENHAKEVSPSNHSSRNLLAEDTKEARNKRAEFLKKKINWANTTPKIMVVDDEPVNVKVVQKYLQNLGYNRVAGCYDSLSAIEGIQHHKPDLLILDIMMPGINGLEILKQIKSQEKYQHLPVIILTAMGDREVKLNALELGASDFLNKPVDPCELAPRVKNALDLKLHQDHLTNYIDELTELATRRTDELDFARREVFNCLARAAEFRDDDTGNHVLRVGKYAGIIARGLGWTPDKVEELELAAQLHDIGKIGVPDAILHKPGKLSDEEYFQMKKHPRYGQRILEDISGSNREDAQMHAKIGMKILEPAQSPVLTLARVIAMSHHERWDGMGYPLGLNGTYIPIEGRITAIADVFDALSSKRPYKPAFPVDKCVSIITEGRGSQFDPQLVDIFVASLEEVVCTMIAFQSSEYCI